jgi:hypothetical protein
METRRLSRRNRELHSGLGDHNFNRHDECNTRFCWRHAGKNGCKKGGRMTELFPAQIARKHAMHICNVLGEFVDRIEIAGSLRRSVPEVHDIDLVAVEKWAYRPVWTPGHVPIIKNARIFSAEGENNRYGKPFNQVFLRRDSS